MIDSSAAGYAWACYPVVECTLSTYILWLLLSRLHHLLVMIERRVIVHSQCCTTLKHGSNRLYHPAQVCSQLHHLGLCEGTF